MDQNRQPRANQHHEAYLDIVRSNNMLLNRIMDHIHTSERTARAQLEHGRTMDQQMLDMLNEPRNRAPRAPPQRGAWSAPTQPFNLDNLSLSPVRIAPSRAHIRRATTDTVFGAIPMPGNAICPITQQPFSPADEVTMIRHCSHIFTRRDLAEWFAGNVRCPVCRHDIREYRGSPADPEYALREPPAPTDDTEEYLADELPVAAERNILSSLADSINDEIERLSGTEAHTDNGMRDREFALDPSGNLTYRFTLRSRPGDDTRDD